MKFSLKLILFTVLSSASLTFASTFPPGNPNFKTDLAQVLTSTKTSGKPTVVVFSAEWCGPCHVMQKKVYPDKKVQAFHDKFEWVYIDVDLDAHEKVIAQYKISSIPHIALLDANGTTSKTLIGLQSVDSFAADLATLLKK